MERSGTSVQVTLPQLQISRFIILPPYLTESFFAPFSALSSTSFCLGDLGIHTESGITDTRNHSHTSWMTTLGSPRVSHNLTSLRNPHKSDASF